MKGFDLTFIIISFMSALAYTHAKNLAAQMKMQRTLGNCHNSLGEGKHPQTKPLLISWLNPDASNMMW